MIEEQQDYSKLRITDIIVDHWYDIKGSRKFPTKKDMDAADLESVLENCFLLCTSGLDNGKFHYHYMGDKVLEAYGSEHTNHVDCEKGNPLAHKEKIQEILDTGEPVIDEGVFKNTDGRLVKYRQCMVPLSSDNNHIDSIFGGLRYKID